MSQRRAKQDSRGQRVQAPKRRERPRDRRRLVLALVAVAIAAVAVTGAVLAVGNKDKAARVAASGSPNAPQFSGTDPITGKRVSLAAYAGKPVVINIWASWCPGCNQEAADLRAFAAAHRGQAQVIGVDTQDTKGGARGFYRRWHWTRPSVFDPQGELAARLALQGLPTTIFLDRRHHVVSRIVGASDRAGFERGLRQALS